MNQDTEEAFAACYESIRDDLTNTVFLSITRKFSTRLLAALLSHREYQELSCAFPGFLELLWAAILGESKILSMSSTTTSISWKNLTRRMRA